MTEKLRIAVLGVILGLSISMVARPVIRARYMACMDREIGQPTNVQEFLKKQDAAQKRCEPSHFIIQVFYN